MNLDAETKLYLNKRIAYTALMLQEYAYREILDSPLIRENDRYLVKRKYKYVQSQIAKINNSSKATKKQIEDGEDIVLDNISLMASIAATLALVPTSQVDFIEKKFTEICLEAISNDEKLQENG
jgi:DNA-binding XRE family transcriptional regulator